MLTFWRIYRWDFLVSITQHVARDDDVDVFRERRRDCHTSCRQQNDDRCEKRSNLPAAWSTFVGRNSELRDIAEMLGSARLVTLTGAGGIGKSRLALEAARSAGGMYPDGVWLVELAALTDEQFVVGAVARVLGLKDRAGQSQGDGPPVWR